MAICNINERYGDRAIFESVTDMVNSIKDCGYDIPEDGLKYGIDYEPIEILPLDDAAMDWNLRQETAQSSDAEWELYYNTDQAGNAPGAELQIAFSGPFARAGIIYTGSGSSGVIHWTDADSPEEALYRYLTDNMIN